MTAAFDSSSPLKVAAVGMDHRMLELLKMAFQGPGKGAFMITAVESADVFIYNMDHVDAGEQWEKYQKAYPQRPAILMALDDPEIANTIYIEKPFRIETLLKTLNTIKPSEAVTPSNEDEKSNTTKQEPSKPTPSLTQEVYNDEREFCGSNPDIDFTNIAALPSIYYKPSDYLQEQIFYAARISNTDNIAVQIAVKVNEKWELITFLPTLKGVFTTLSDFQLRVICTAPKYCTEIKVHRYSADETSILENGPKTKTSIQNNEPFLWKVALWTSRGRLPQGTSLSAPVKLYRWPNFTRLHTTPNCMRIATLLLDDSRPLKVVAKVLNIPQRHVFAFYTAAYALGLATNVNTANNAMDASSQGKKHKQHSLLGRILRRLKGAVAN